MRGHSRSECYSIAGRPSCVSNAAGRLSGEHAPPESHTVRHARLPAGRRCADSVDAPPGAASAGPALRPPSCRRPPCDAPQQHFVGSWASGVRCSQYQVHIARCAGSSAGVISRPYQPSVMVKLQTGPPVTAACTATRTAWRGDAAAARVTPGDAAALHDGGTGGSPCQVVFHRQGPDCVRQLQSHRP